MNPINPNKFISFKDQQSMGQLNDPLQTEQNFLANRMSQPVPVPEVQSPMMQTNYPHARVKQRVMQPLEPVEKFNYVKEAVVQPMQQEVQKPYRTGYERIVRNRIKEPEMMREEPARIQEVPQEIQSPFRQDDPGTKYNHVGVQNLQKKGFIFDDKKGPYVVNEELTGTSRDTLRLPTNVWRSPKNEPYNSGNLIDDVEYVELANKANKK
jgi:hypothetical protein